ncbi:hypothetical protein GJAV_G00236780 [Gymnothorax javanicus]|nr:hypothetical protein GJAV_G00236780 [Gymnothorax javanicus]
MDLMELVSTDTGCMSSLSLVPIDTCTSNEELLCQDTQTSVGHIAYTTQLFMGSPQLQLLINGTNITFLVDSGATHSCRTSSTLPTKPALNAKWLMSTSVSEHCAKEFFTVLLLCKNDQGREFTHSLCSPCMSVESFGTRLNV